MILKIIRDFSVKVLALIIMLMPILFSGQNTLPNKLKFNSLRVENGLPNNIINTITQDSLGFIWIGTNDGLCRFDGKSFKIFRESFNSKNSISNNFVQSLFVDQKGNLWVMTDQGLNKYNIDTERFEVFHTDNAGLSHNSITTMTELSNGTYYIGTYGGGIDVLKNGEIIKNFNQTDNDGISSNLISSLVIENDSVLWVGTYNSGLNRINLKTNDVDKFGLVENEPTLSNKINNLLLDKSGMLWVGSETGLCVFNTQTGTYFTITDQNSPGFSDNDILCIFEDRNGIIWLGTRNSGILTAHRSNILLNREQTSFEKYEANENDESVDYRSISSFHQDNQGNVWIGTHLAGINIVNPNGERVRLYNHFLGNNESISSKSVWGICEDNSNNSWVGTDGAGVFKINLFTHEIENFVHDDSNPGSISDNAILSACFDKKGNLWLGTYAGGLNKLEPGSREFKHYRQSNGANSLNSDDIRVIFEDSHQRIWIGTNGQGLHLYQSATDDFKFITEVGWLDVRSLTEDTQGNIWIGTFGNGILSYNLEKNEMKNYPIYDDFNAHIVFDLECTSEKDLWIGTRYKGLLHMNLETLVVDQFTENEGLSNNTIHSIVPESDKQLWVSTNEGLNLFDVIGKKFVSYKNASGVQSKPFNNNSGFISQNGYIVFGGINGLNAFYPSELKKETEKLDIIFTDFKIYNNSVTVSIEDGKTPLKKSISKTEQIELKYNQDVITIDYAVLNYPSSEGINYEYKMLNYDNDWNKVGSLTSATYRNLSPGEYVFEVKIDDGIGYRVSNARSLKIIVTPPFWLTIPALLFYFVLALAIAFLIIRYYTDQIKLRNSLYYEKKLRQQETDLNKERFRFFTNFSHELRTPLTLILGPVSDVLREKNNRHEGKLKLIKRNAQILLELINKMLEFRKSETEHNHLEVGKYNLTEFLNEIVENFKFYANQKQIHIKSTITKNHHIWFDYKKMQLVITNILSNAFKYTNRNGHVNISVEDKGEKILLHIKDDGIGIKKEALKAIFNLYYHTDYGDTVEGTGIGLALCKKLMDLHKGSITVNSKEGEGTCFTLELFKFKDHFANIENIEYLEENNFKIKKPFINHSELHYHPEKIKDFADDDKVVLIVDDNSDVVNYVSDILSSQYKISTATNGKEGIEKAIEIVPDLIVSDIMMPIKSGVDLCLELKNNNQTSHIPIILLTAKLGDHDRLEGTKIGADDYITKPFDSEFLLARIDNLFKNRKKLINHYHFHIGGSSEIKKAVKSKEDIFVDKLKLLILEKYNGNEVSIVEIAKELGFSRSSLYRKINALSGLSINQFIRKIRLNQAAHLLINDDLNVSQAAFETGFNDLKYFRACFKSQFGVTPSSYKATNSNKRLKTYLSD